MKMLQQLLYDGMRDPYKCMSRLFRVFGSSRQEVKLLHFSSFFYYNVLFYWRFVLRVTEIGSYKKKEVGYHTTTAYTLL